MERLSTPPSTPADGDSYLVIATATDDWAGHENDIAVYDDVNFLWEFTTPEKTDMAYDDSDDKLYIFTGTAWVLAANGWSGSFTNADGNTVTVTNGLIINIQ